MEPQHRCELKLTHSLFIDDLKDYQKNHELLSTLNEMIVKASDDTEVCYRMRKYAEMIFEHGKIVKENGMDLGEERMRTLDPDTGELYKFL